MSDRIFNFSAGPAVLPEPVLKQAQKDLWNVAGSGIGVAEHSHRGKVFDRIFAETEALARELGAIPSNYKLLFLQGGATLQFSMVPLCLLPRGRTADYLNTGVWSQKAIAEARKVGDIHVAASSEDTSFDRIPDAASVRWSANPAYAHFTSNNTIYGTQFVTEPAAPAGVPLICDASSDIYSKPIDVSRYGLIYAGAQKNLGPSGVTWVIIRDDLADLGPKELPILLQYRTHVKDGSMHNTPNTFGIYLMGEVFKWIKAEGGLKGMQERNERKAKLLYDAIDGSTVFKARALPGSRSLMNVCFSGPSEEVDNRFVAEATKRGLDGLKGHRSAGGIRASIYNAMPEAGIRALVDFIHEFEKTV
ncbi:MAG: 3-phosphoserine/phosphohydroxythreonine transaminase [Gemmatimonadales bacterium]|nr:3-phosphoserine/phosphohydroxythreonine transaminase [Gemmatimonadales bacterium]